MNIAFWSNVRHRSGVTSCVALVSVLWAELFVEEIAVTANHICNGGLIKRLYGGSEHEERTAKREYIYTLGEPEYFRMLYSGKMSKTLWLNDSLRFVPMEGEEVELFGIEGLNSVKKIAEESAYLMIDTACGCGQSSQKILDDAEITVVLLPPEKECVDIFFQSQTALRENSFFILGNYRPSTAYCPSYIIRKYNIPKERVGIIPYNPGFEQAMREGSTIAYVARNMNCSKRDHEYRFFRQATKTVASLREYVIGRRKEVCKDYENV